MSTPARLGTVESSEQLLHDLYVDLRAKIRRWAAVTKQTPQARMGYVGQHLVSVVTGYEGGRSGARGKDLVISSTEFAEIKTCYRVDQLGNCLRCKARVASVEESCPSCGSTEIERHDDSKWLIGFQHEDEFREFLRPKWYFLALFEFADLPRVDTVQVSIWRVDPLVPGFALCLVDYRYNIQATSKSRAPFNLWPYSPKFDFMRPLLIYRARINADDSIETTLFPGRDAPEPNRLKPLADYEQSRNLSSESITSLAQELGLVLRTGPKKASLQQIEEYARARDIPGDTLADAIARAVYGDRIRPHLSQLPDELRPAVEQMLCASLGSQHSDLTLEV